MENIKRNDEMISSLNIHSRLNQLSAANKRQRVQTKCLKISPENKTKMETPIVTRQSPRTRGMPPDSSTASGLKYDPQKSTTTPKISPCEMGPIRMRDTYTGANSDRKLIEKILGVSKKFQLNCFDGVKEDIDSKNVNIGFLEVKNKIKSQVSCFDGVKEEIHSKNVNIGCLEMKNKIFGSIDVEKLALEPENISRVVPGIMIVKFFPTADMITIVVGNKFGDVGFWNADAEKEDGDGIYVYHPHSGPVSGFAFQPFSLSKSNMGLG